MDIFDKAKEKWQSIKTNVEADRSLENCTAKDSGSNNKSSTFVEYSSDELNKIIEGFVDKYSDPSIDGYIKFLISFYSISSLKNVSDEFHTLKQYDRTDQLREYLKGIAVNINDLKQYKREILECCIDFEKPNHTPDYNNCVSLQIMEFCIKQLEVLIPEKSKIRIPYCTIPSYILFNRNNYDYIPEFAGNKRFEEIGNAIIRGMGSEYHKFYSIAKSFFAKQLGLNISREDEKSAASILVLPTIYGKDLMNGKSEEDVINEELNKINDHSGTLLVILPYDWLKKENNDKHKRLQLLPKKVVSLPYQVNDKPIAWLCFQKNNDAQTLLYNASQLKGDNIVDKLLRLVRTKGPEYKENEGLDPGTIVTFSIDEFTTRFSEQFDNDKKPHYFIHPYHLSESYSSCDINLNDIDQKPSNNDKLHRLESDSFVIVKSKNTGKVRIGYIPNRTSELYIEENDYVNFKIKKDGRIQKDYLLNKIFTTLKSAESSMETAFNAIRLVDLPAIRQLENVLELERIEKKESDKIYEGKILEEYEKYKLDIRTKKHNLSQYISKLSSMILNIEDVSRKEYGEEKYEEIRKIVEDLKLYDKIIAANVNGFTGFEISKKIIGDFCLYKIVNEFINSLTNQHPYFIQEWESVPEECKDKVITFSEVITIGILENIRENAKEHGGFKRDKIGKVRYSLNLLDDKLILEIKNNGKPIHGEFEVISDNNERITQRMDVSNMFIEGTSTKKNKEGHGLGCYSMKTYLEHTDEEGNAYGSIKVESNPEEEYKVKYILTFNKIKR